MLYFTKHIVLDKHLQIILKTKQEDFGVIAFPISLFEWARTVKKERKGLKWWHRITMFVFYNVHLLLHYGLLDILRQRMFVLNKTQIAKDTS